MTEVEIGIEHASSSRRARSGERAWQLAAALLLVGGVVLLGVIGSLGYVLSELGGASAATVRTAAAAVRSSGREGPPPLPRGWRHTPANAVIFYGGYFCARGPAGRRVRLVLTASELDTLVQGSSRVVGPSSSSARTRGMC